MFRPNIQAQLMRKQAKRTIHGTTLYEPAQPITLAVVTLGTTVTESSVRADSAASRGASEITQLQAKLLLPASIVVATGDVILVQGYRVEVAGKAPRNNVVGRLDHWEITGNLKAE
jgi:ABC-type iron transport system FetAB permease component